MNLLCLLTFICSAVALHAEQYTIIIDRSDSMSGYALNPSGIQLGASLRRIATILSATGQVSVSGFSGPSNLPQPMHALNLTQTEDLFSRRNAFGGNTPLQGILQRVVGADGQRNIICITDGMEDGGAIERLADFLRGLSNDWELGILAITLPFDGIYYTEGVIPADFVAQIRQGLTNQTWTVKSTSCLRPGSCYSFRGQRPMLFLMLSRTKLDPLFKAVREGLSENRIDVRGEVQLAPASKSSPQVSLDAPSATRRLVRLPVSPSGTMICSQPEPDPMHVLVRLNPAKSDGLPRPSRVVLSGFRILEQPGWVTVPPKKAETKPDGSTELDFQVRCLNEGGFFSSETALKGKLQIELQPALEASSAGWWSDLSASNSWQYPFKTYKLDFLTRQIHSAALQQVPMQPVRVSLEMRVRH